ncbi:MAG: nucleotidyltransferase domain-containing protein [Spirochaetales bacterium]|nr:nucleotidyltransferase domain-containing protein [Spirochaetales bacterium]MCF7939478.1 nucleotidyltransferase domain-containing protein [Spirochaetales bacterium]
MTGTANEKITEQLSAYFARRSDIAFAVLFGSFARGEERNWADVEKICEVETDLLVMNHAPAWVVSTALCDGKTLHIADRPVKNRPGFLS